VVKREERWEGEAWLRRFRRQQALGEEVREYELDEGEREDGVATVETKPHSPLSHLLLLPSQWLPRT